jgi:two-component system OmpR family sensor kinase
MTATTPPLRPAAVQEKTRREGDRASRRRARFSLRWRLTLWFGIGFAATLIALFLTLHQLLVNTLLNDVDDELTAHAHRIAAEAADPETMSSPASLEELVKTSTLGGLVTKPSLTAIRDRRGRLLASSSGIRLDEIALTRRQISKATQGQTSFRTIKTDGGQQVRIVTVPIMAGNQLLGVVQAGESEEGLFTAGERLQVLLAIEGMALLVMAGAAGYFFARRSLRPLDRVGAVARDIEANDLTRRLDLHGQPVEVQTLADTFNAMLDRLEHSFAQQRSFVLDVSHELRTPLTALRGNLDVLLMDASLPADVRMQVERMSAETGRLIRLAANLLYLAQADTGKQGIMADVELDLLCLEVVQQAVNVRPGVRLRLGHEDQVTVHGDRDLLKQLLLNLVENGLTYTPAGGEVTLSLFRAEDLAVIEVRDTGVGIAPDDLPHIFNRFYRAESTRRRAAGGAGVGLAIVDWVATMHGGTVEVESEPGKGSVFTVHLPLAAAEASASSVSEETVSDVDVVPAAG